MFGLAAPRVARLIQALPGAERCERYSNWPEGEAPEAPPLVSWREGKNGACLSMSLIYVFSALLHAQHAHVAVPYTC